jgi:hypothetical protein
MIFFLICRELEQSTRHRAKTLGTPLFAESNTLGTEKLFTKKIENSKQPRKFSKIYYVTTNDVYYYKNVLVLKVNFEFPLDYSKPIDISLNSLKLSVRCSSF